ncbi:MAG: hypothetical protein ABI256_01885 [Rhodoferax sp.]
MRISGFPWPRTAANRKQWNTDTGVDGMMNRPGNGSSEMLAQRQQLDDAIAQARQHEFLDAVMRAEALSEDFGLTPYVLSAFVGFPVTRWISDAFQT